MLPFGNSITPSFPTPSADVRAATKSQTQYSPEPHEIPRSSSKAQSQDDRLKESLAASQAIHGTPAVPGAKRSPSIWLDRGISSVPMNSSNVTDTIPFERPAARSHSSGIPFWLQSSLEPDSMSQESGTPF